MNNSEKFNQKYSRQILLKEIGENGQEMLSTKTAAIVGIGALGTVAAELLIRAGIGKLILIDRDYIEESNLQRQVLFTEQDVGKSKALTAKEKLQQINSSSKIMALPIHLSVDNSHELSDADIILDCTDNMETRFLINDYCKKEQKPWIYAAAIKTSGYIMPLFPDGPCLQCFLPNVRQETCDTVGVLNTIIHAVASLQVTLALKIMVGKPVDSALYNIDIWNFSHKTIHVSKNQFCKACQGEYLYLQREESNIIRFCTAGKFQVQGKSINVEELKKRWQKIETVIDDGISLRFQNIYLFRDGRALITTDSKEKALTIYAKYVGS